MKIFPITRATPQKGATFLGIAMIIGFICIGAIGMISFFGGIIKNEISDTADLLSDNLDNSHNPSDPPGADPAGLSYCPSGHPLSIEGANKHLARGFNLPNWDPSHTGFDPDDTLLSELRSAGYSHIRIPLDADMIIPEFSNSSVIENYMAALEATVTRLVALDYAVTIDMHPGDNFSTLHETNPSAAYPILQNAWDRLNSASTNWPLDKVYFELLNEPIDHHVWWSQAQSLITHLNTNAPGRQIIVGSGVWQRYEPLISSNPLNGDNIIYAIHFYDPMALSHSGISWDPGSPLSRLHDLPFPGDINHSQVQTLLSELQSNGDTEAIQTVTDAYDQPWTYDRINAVFEQVNQWASTHNVAVIVNEFGILNFAVAESDRARWIEAVRQGAETSCVGWAHWDFSDGFAFVDKTTGQPIQSIHDALTGHLRP